MGASKGTVVLLASDSKVGSGASGGETGHVGGFGLRGSAGALGRRIGLVASSEELTVGRGPN